MKYYSEYDSPLGRITLASNGEAICGLWFEGQKYFGSGKEPDFDSSAAVPVFETAKGWLDDYFSGKKPEYLPPLDPAAATPFRRLVWQQLLKIPYGSLATYGRISEDVAKELELLHMSAQAVGGAIAHNPISLMIPCHRVIGSDGSLTGYAGGIWRKKALLEMESGGLLG